MLPHQWRKSKLKTKGWFFLTLIFRERACMHMHEQEMKAGGEHPSQSPHGEWSLIWAQSHNSETMTWMKIKSLTLNQLRHPSTPHKKKKKKVLKKTETTYTFTTITWLFISLNFIQFWSLLNTIFFWLQRLLIWKAENGKFYIFLITDSISSLTFL